jgi:hypothetical protein
VAVEEPDLSGELGRDVDHILAGFEEALGERTPHSVGALDGPDPVRPDLRVLPHRGVAGLVGGEPAGPEELLVLVDDLDRGRQLVGIDPDDDVLQVLLPPVSTDRDFEAAQSRAVPSGATPRPRCPTGCRPKVSHTRQRAGSRMESIPSDTWTESGQTPILREVSSSRD